jgi:hypothetical protein
MTLGQFLGDDVEGASTRLRCDRRRGNVNIRMSITASSSIDRQISTTRILALENFVATLAYSNTSAVMRCRAR